MVLPANSSPRTALDRFDRALETESADAYRDLFTSDYVFEFSVLADPDLVAQYGTTWSRTQEDQAQRNLFGDMTTITVTLTADSVGVDLQHPDSTAHYARVSIVPTLVATSSDSEFQTDSPQEFLLVRGDAALLPAGVPADSTHWYIRRWRDRATGFVVRNPIVQPARPVAIEHARAMPDRSVTWGRLKATYL